MSEMDTLLESKHGTPIFDDHIYCHDQHTYDRFLTLLNKT